MKRRLTVIAMMLLATACSRDGEIGDGGIYVTRSPCPQVGIPAATGDITLFNPTNRSDAAALDSQRAHPQCRAKLQRFRPMSCPVASFDVVATRRDAGPRAPLSCLFHPSPCRPARR